LTLSVPDKGYYRKASFALNYIYNVVIIYSREYDYHS
jgi:hypothetical protein